ncbi:MAG: tRNA (adenosine(37)-N6)-threonylcarbamoyltransferase complex dimerization subunit type 1 TsaB [Sphingomonadales bacterium]|jgi:tRNA threonylcarbamoyladenosine biosynthesis protein TsaB
MLTLAFDTCMGRCSVAVGDVGRCFASRSDTMPRGQAEVLMPMIADVLAEAQLDISDIKRIGVTVGPGSFTGVRIGVAAAKALALVHDLPIVALTTLEAVALQADVNECIIAQNARRSEVYVQHFAKQKAMNEPQLMSLEEARQMAIQSALPIGGTAAALICEDAQLLLQSDAEVQPESLLRLCEDGRPALRHDQLQPLYLRPPDAKLPKLSPIAALRQKLVS